MYLDLYNDMSLDVKIRLYIKWKFLNIFIYIFKVVLRIKCLYF